MLSTKIFLGQSVTYEMRRQLKGKGKPEELIFTPYEGKEYLGIYLPSSHPSLEEVRLYSAHLTDSLYNWYPELRASALLFVLFPQSFLG